ncbi:MAG: LemA family protein [Flavobacteriales bacterium]|nr:LemA family protein [Flavobacteriales bacterium]MCC6938839.1 LemA family protein [Flavobacteriales bacterium]
MRKYLGLFIALGAILLIAFWMMGMYNGMKRAEINVTKQWGQVEVAYQARADKSKNLVEIVKGAADFESQTLKDVVAARAKAISITLTGDDLTPEKIKAFEAAQANLGGAIGRLLVENYPTLQAVQSFRDFQAQYEGMENRIAHERHNFNEVVADYNTRIQVVPASLFAGMFGFHPKEGFSSDAGTENAPDISFK